MSITNSNESLSVMICEIFLGNFQKKSLIRSDEALQQYKSLKYGLFISFKPLFRLYCARAFAPDTISKISLVIAAWRALL